MSLSSSLQRPSRPPPAAAPSTWWRAHARHGGQGSPCAPAATRAEPPTRQPTMLLSPRCAGSTRVRFECRDATGCERGRSRVRATTAPRRARRRRRWRERRARLRTGVARRCRHARGRSRVRRSHEARPDLSRPARAWASARASLRRWWHSPSPVIFRRKLAVSLLCLGLRTFCARSSSKACPSLRTAPSPASPPRPARP